MPTPHFSDPLSHPLLTQVGCPPSGNGAPLYLQQLALSLQACQRVGFGASAEEWLLLTRNLSKALTLNKPTASTSPTASDLAHQPWGVLHGCIEARRDVKTQSTDYLDTLLAQIVLHAAAGGIPATATAFQGLRSCYVALSGRRRLHEEWSLLTTRGLIEQATLTDILKGISHSPAQAFGALVLSYLERPMPTAAGIDVAANQPPKAIQDAHDELALTLGRPEVAVYTEHTDDAPLAHEVAPGAHQERFQRGDSIIGWHVKRASNAKRNDRLALESWSSLPIKETCKIASKLVPILADDHSPWHQAGVLATVSLLTSTPANVLLHSNVNTEGDVNIDLLHQRFSWPLSLLRGEKIPATSTDTQRMIKVPFPICLANALANLTKDRDPRGIQHFSDVFGVAVGSAAWEALLKQNHELLKELSSPSSPAFPGHWASSLSRVYLDVHGSDLFASACALDLAITPLAALYYFHPSEQDIQEVAQQVFLRLGLGPCVSYMGIEQDRGIVSDSQIRNGFEQIEARSRTLISHAMRAGSDLASTIKSLNELTQMSAALSVFLVGGRGSRVEEITCGALFCNKDFLWIEDKKVEHESSSRILPKPAYLKLTLHRLFMCRQAVAERLTAVLRRDLASRWKELASGQLRFDAPAFEYITLKSDKVARTPVTSNDIEQISQRYFSAGKNFMRHVLITQWAISGSDRHLLRLITGHATAGLAIPAAGAIYTPESAAHAAAEVLEKMLQRWLAGIKNGTPIPDAYRFSVMPGRRILATHFAYREHIEKWSAPVLSRWHLASVRIMDRIRQLLLGGHGPVHPHARLWLSLVSFDAIHENGDLHALFEKLEDSFERGTGGWVIKLQRKDSRHALIAPVQLPTSLLLCQLSGSALKGSYSYTEVLKAAGKWLTDTTPDCWGGRAAEAQAAAEALLACSRLWADWCLPSVAQVCYASESHAPVLDHGSNASLFGLRTSRVAVGSPPRRHHPKSSNELFTAFFKVVNRLGSSQFKLGERRKRAQLFERWVRLSRVPEEGEIVCALIKVSMVNVVRIRANKRSAIEWSSQSTYFSTLRPFLIAVRDLDPGSLDELDWHEFCVGLLTFANAEEKQKATSAEAAQWLLDAMRELGYPLPSRQQLAQVRKYPVPTITTAIASFTPEQSSRATAMLLASANSPLERARAKVAITLLLKLPMRWGELATLHRSNVTADGDIRITSAGFSQLKSFSARRRLSVEGALREGLRALLCQLDALEESGINESLIFGSKKQNDGVEVVSSAWIRDAITTSVKNVTGNPSFRVHAFRAHVVSQRLHPDWMNRISSAPRGDFGPTDAKATFKYQEENAWATDLVRLAAGHASIQTTLGYYFHAWFPTRTLALLATLERNRISEALLKEVGVTPAALSKAGTRDRRFRRDPWLYLQRKLASTLKRRALAEGVADAAVGPSGECPMATNAMTSGDLGSEPSTGKPTAATPSEACGSQLSSRVRYLGLRMLGTDRQTAANLAHDLDRAVTEHLEFKLTEWTSSPTVLRARIKGDITGRAMAADVRQMQSPSANHLMDVLSKMPTERIQILLQLLTPRGSSLNWSDEVVATAPWLANSVVCLEVVSDIRRVDPALNHQLARTQGVIVGAPANDVGPLPRIYVQSTEVPKRNTVAKARWTTLTRVICSALLLLDEPAP